jgi:hypothetical protein
MLLLATYLSEEQLSKQINDDDDDDDSNDNKNRYRNELNLSDY